MQAHELDQRHDLRLGPAKPDRATADSKPASQQRQIDHQRGVGERELREIHDHVGLSTDRPGQRATTNTLGCPVLVAATAERCGVFIESDDPTNLPKPVTSPQALPVNWLRWQPWMR